MTHDAIMWYPIYQYFFNSLSDGVFPLWEPYLGTNFFGILNLLGCLDPLTFPLTLLAVLCRLNPYDTYIYLYIIKHLFFFTGAFYFYNTASQNNRVAALFGTFVLTCTVIPFALRQNGFVHNSSTYVPWIFYGLLRILNPELSMNIRKGWIYWTALFAVASLYSYIPSYTITAVVLFVVLSFIFKVFKISNFVSLFKSAMWKTVLKAFIGLMLTLPFIFVLFHYLQDTDEFFPFVRIHQSFLFDTEKVRQYVLGDITTGLLTDKSYQQDIFSVWENLAMLVVPWSDGIYFSYLKGPVKGARDLMDGVAFLGIIPFFFAMYAILFSRSRFKWPTLIATCIIAFLMTGKKVMEGHFLHSVYQLLPIANLVHVYENFMGVFLLNLCFLVVLGVMELQKKDFRNIINRRFIITIVVCILMVTAILFMLDFLFLAYNKSLTPTYIHLGVAFFALFAAYMIFITALNYTKRRFVIFMLTVLSLVEILIHINPRRPDSYSGFAMNVNSIQKNDSLAKYRSIEYSPYRAAWLPAYGDFVTFQPLFSQICTAYIQYASWPGNFIFLPRFFAQYLYSTPFENQRYLSGVLVPKLMLVEQAFTLDNNKLILDSLKNYNMKNIIDLTHSFPLLISDTDCSGVKLEEGIFEQWDRQIDYAALYSYGLNFPKHVYSRSFCIKESDWVKVSSLPFSFCNTSILTAFCNTRGAYVVDLAGLIHLKDGHNFPYSTIDKSTIGRFFINYYTSTMQLDGNYVLCRKIFPLSVHNEPLNYGLDHINEKAVLFQGKLYTDVPQRMEISWDDPPEIVDFHHLGNIEVVDFGQNHIKIRCTVIKPCYLYYADAWSKFWSACDNGSPTKILRSNYTFKSVFLSAGDHILEFVYNPPYFRTSLVVSYTAIFLLFVFGINSKFPISSKILSFIKLTCKNLKLLLLK